VKGPSQVSKKIDLSGRELLAHKVLPSINIPLGLSVRVAGLKPEMGPTANAGNEKDKDEIKIKTVKITTEQIAFKSGHEEAVLLPRVI